MVKCNQSIRRNVRNVLESKQKDICFFSCTLYITLTRRRTADWKWMCVNFYLSILKYFTFFCSIKPQALVWSESVQKTDPGCSLHSFYLSCTWPLNFSVFVQYWMWPTEGSRKLLICSVRLSEVKWCCVHSFNHLFKSFNFRDCSFLFEFIVVAVIVVCGQNCVLEYVCPFELTLICSLGYSLSASFTPQPMLLHR